MTEKEQCIAIAEFYGWTLRKRVFHNQRWQDVPTWFAPEFQDYPVNQCPAGQVLGAMPPDYLHDLNAMHEAECRLKVNQITEWIGWMVKVADRQSRYGPDDGLYWTIHSTAAQRAEALLRCIGRWID